MGLVHILNIETRYHNGYDMMSSYRPIQVYCCMLVKRPATTQIVLNIKVVSDTVKLVWSYMYLVTPFYTSMLIDITFVWWHYWLLLISQNLLSLVMMKGDVGVDIAFTLLAGGLITKASSLCEPIKKMPGSYIVWFIWVLLLIMYTLRYLLACMPACTVHTV